MFALGVPVPGTISAVAPTASAAMNADATPRTAEVSSARQAIAKVRTDLRMQARSHIADTLVSGTKKVAFANFGRGCRIGVTPFVGQVESGAEGSAPDRKVIPCTTSHCCSASPPHR